MNPGTLVCVKGRLWLPMQRPRRRHSGARQDPPSSFGGAGWRVTGAGAADRPFSLSGARRRGRQP